MDKETLSNYGWITICVLVIAVMVALATPFGSFIKTAVENTTQGLYDTSAGAINSTELMSIAGQSFDDSNASGGADSYNHDDPSLHPTVVAKGCVYRSGSTVYNSGDSIPVPQTGDEYETADYYYGYTNLSNYDGWGVRIKNDSKTSYEPILESIGNKSIKNMFLTFAYCSNLTTMPVIPNGVTDLESAFEGCTSLTTAPTIPNGVTNMQGTFHGCTSLTTAPEIPNSVTGMNGTFYECTSLTTATAIPNSVTGLIQTFYGCTSLTGTITVNANPTDYYGCLYNTGITNITGECSEATKTALMNTKNQE